MAGKFKIYSFQDDCGSDDFSCKVCEKSFKKHGGLMKHIGHSVSCSSFSGNLNLAAISNGRFLDRLQRRLRRRVRGHEEGDQEVGAGGRGRAQEGGGPQEAHRRLPHEQVTPAGAAWNMLCASKWNSDPLLFASGEARRWPTSRFSPSVKLPVS